MRFFFPPRDGFRRSPARRRLRPEASVLKRKRSRPLSTKKQQSRTCRQQEHGKDKRGDTGRFLYIGVCCREYGFGSGNSLVHIDSFLFLSILIRYNNSRQTDTPRLPARNRPPVKAVTKNKPLNQDTSHPEDIMLAGIVPVLGTGGVVNEGATISEVIHADHEIPQ